YEVTSGFGFPDHRALIAHFHLMQATRREWLRRNQEKSRCSVQWGYLSNGWLKNFGRPAVHLGRIDFESFRNPQGDYAPITFAGAPIEERIGREIQIRMNFGRDAVVTDRGRRRLVGSAAARAKGRPQLKRWSRCRKLRAPAYRNLLKFRRGVKKIEAPQSSTAY